MRSDAPDDAPDDVPARTPKTGSAPPGSRRGGPLPIAIFLALVVLLALGLTLNPREVELSPSDGRQEEPPGSMLPTGARVRLLVAPTEPGLFMYHCHNLEHEDQGMMRNCRFDARSPAGRT
jgi:hypothetical protein